MPRTKVSLCTIRYITSFSKVSSFHNSYDSIKTRNLLQNLSTATEKLDFQNPDGYNVDNSLQYDQSPSGFYTEHDLNGSGGFRKTPINDCVNKPVGQNWKFSGVNGESYGDLQQNRMEKYHKASGGYRESFSSEQQSTLGGQNGNFEGNYGKIDGDLKQKSNWIYGESSRGFEQNSNQFNQNHVGVNRESTRNELWNNTFQQIGKFSGCNWNDNGQLQQNLSGTRAQMLGDGVNARFSESQGSYNGNHMQNSGQYQQMPNDHYTGEFGLYQNSPSVYQQNQNAAQYQWDQSYRQYQQNPNAGQYPSNSSNNYNGMVAPQELANHKYEGDGVNARFSESQGSYNGNHMQNSGQYQQMPNDHYTGEFGLYQNSPSVYQQNQNAAQYQWDQSHRQYQQNPNAGQYPSNSSNNYNGMVAPQELANHKHEGESTEAFESRQNNDTLEELDCLVKEGKVKEAAEVLGLLEKQCIPVDLPRLLHLMNACGEAKALEEAKAVHEHVERLASPLKVSTYNRILKMYSDCGSMDNAFTVFNTMTSRNLTSWDTMITGLAKNGLGEDAVDLFSQFKQTGLKPDGQMFIGAFLACSVLGDVNEGMLHFESMSKDYGIVPSMKHYASIIDMLGSTGYLDEALEFIEKMPMEPDVDVWEKLMNLCRIHGNLELGDRSAEIVEQLDPSRLNDKSKAGLVPVKATELAKEQENKKLVSQNLLELRSRVHEYRAGDTSHPETDKIYALIRGLKAQMKEAGYIPETRFVLHDIDQEGKEEALLAHSERLAVSHGLLSSPARAPIRIIKNLRVCGDCHSALKIISKIVGRELIIRDAKRFHHFKDGLCSCRDYW